MVWVKHRTKEDDVTTMMNKLLETVDRPPTVLDSRR